MTEYRDPLWSYKIDEDGDITLYGEPVDGDEFSVVFSRGDLGLQALGEGLGDALLAQAIYNEHGYDAAERYVNDSSETQRLHAQEIEDLLGGGDTPA